MNGQPSVIVAVFQSPGSNALATANALRQTMAELKQRFPSDLDSAVVFDTTRPVSEGMKETVRTLFEAMVLVIIVVFLFLQNWRATR
jgi:HAE1 family hydrophobic/amphiphilic exporter-1